MRKRIIKRNERKGNKLHQCERIRKNNRKRAAGEQRRGENSHWSAGHGRQTRNRETEGVPPFTLSSARGDKWFGIIPAAIVAVATSPKGLARRISSPSRAPLFLFFFKCARLRSFVGDNAPLNGALTLPSRGREEPRQLPRGIRDCPRVRRGFEAFVMAEKSMVREALVGNGGCYFWYLIWGLAVVFLIYLIWYL